MKKLQVPYNLDINILKVYERYSDVIAEIYFAPHTSLFPTARQYDAINEEDYNKELCQVCKGGTEHNIDTMLLLNGTTVQFTNELFIRLQQTIYLLTLVNLKGVVVANPILAEWIHKNFPDLKIRLSVLSYEDDITKLNQLDKLGYINEICLSPRWLRDLDGIRELKKHTKMKLSAIINGMCRINCPLYGWHHCIFNSNSDGSKDNFSIIAETFITQTDKLEQNLLKSPSLLPTELEYYDDVLDGFKMEDRTMTTQALQREIFYYANRINPKIYGDILHGSCLRAELLNIPINKLDTYWRKYIRNCKGLCYQCDYCDKVRKEIEDEIKAESCS